MDLIYVLLNQQTINVAITYLNGRDILRLTSVCKTLYSLRNNRDLADYYYKIYHKCPNFKGISDEHMIEIFADKYCLTEKKNQTEIIKGKSKSNTELARDDFDRISPSSNFHQRDPFELIKVHFTSTISPPFEETPDSIGISSLLPIIRREDIPRLSLPIKFKYICPICDSTIVDKCGHLPKYLTFILSMCPPPCQWEVRYFIPENKYYVDNVEMPEEIQKSDKCIHLLKRNKYCGVETTPYSDYCRYHIYMKDQPRYIRKCSLGPWVGCPNKSYKICSSCWEANSVMLIPNEVIKYKMIIVNFNV